MLFNTINIHYPDILIHLNIFWYKVRPSKFTTKLSKSLSLNEAKHLVINVIHRIASNPMSLMSPCGHKILLQPHPFKNLFQPHPQCTSSFSPQIPLCHYQYPSPSLSTLPHLFFSSCANSPSILICCILFYAHFMILQSTFKFDTIFLFLLHFFNAQKV